MKFSIEAAGGAKGKTDEIEIPRPYSFILNVGRKPYRFSFDRDGNIQIALINGVDVRVINDDGYPAIKLIHH